MLRALKLVQNKAKIGPKVSPGLTGGWGSQPLHNKYYLDIIKDKG